MCSLNQGDGKSVVLVFPGKLKAADPQIPLSLLHVASPLRRAGYKVKIHDARLENLEGIDVGDPVFVGISSMSGLQISHALSFAEKVRRSNPSVPIVWGGVHPSLLPEETIANPLVDIVVRGEAETAIVDLADTLASGSDLSKVPSITYKTEGKIKSTPDGKPIDLDTIYLELPFDLLQMDKYPAFKAGRFHLQTSRGCPHACGFCYNSIFNKRRWRGKSAERVLDEFEYVLKRFPHVKIIDPIDDNFFVDRTRVERICQGIIDRGINVSWRANCRFDYMAEYDREFVGLLQKSGCIELDFGAETGSPRLLSLMEKGVTPEQMIKSVENIKNWAPKIEPYVSWMSGLPEETYDDLKITFDLMDKMTRTNEKTQHFGMFIYTPFPSPIAGSLGSRHKLPQSLEEWGEVDVFHFKPPWHSKKYVNRLNAISAVTRYAFFPKGRINERGTLFRIGYGATNRLMRFRWKHRYFGMPVELKIIDGISKRLRGFI